MFHDVAAKSARFGAFIPIPSSFQNSGNVEISDVLKRENSGGLLI
jgi:hypothetical protein